VTFLEPWFLWGLALAAVPIAIHLLSRRRFRPVRWAATDFLLAALAERSRDVRLQDLVLLALRTAALVGAVLLAARPVLSPRAADLAGLRAGPLDAVFIVDTSYSMRMNVAGRTRLDIARGRAREVLASLPTGSRVAVLASEDPRAPSGRKLEENRALAAAAIDGIEPSARGGDVLPALEAALNLLAGSTAPSKRICIFTDGQARFFEGREIRRVLAEADPSIRCTVVLVPAGPEPNLVVAGLRVESRRLRPLAPAEIAAEIRDAGEPAAGAAAVDLVIDGRKVDRAKVALEGRRGTARFRYAFGETGLHTIEARLDPDALEIDSSRSMAIFVPSTVDVVVVSGERGAGEGETAHAYVEAALSQEPDPPTPDPPESLHPGRYPPGEGRYPDEDPSPLPFRVRPAAEPGRLERELDDGLWTAILADPGALGEGALRALGSFAERGGAVLIAAGPRGASTLGSFRSAREGAAAWLHGIDFSLPQEAGSGAPALRLSLPPAALPGTEAIPLRLRELPVLDLEATDLREAFGAVGFFRALALDAPAESGWSTMLRFSGGRPALLGRAVGGRGRAALLVSSLDPSWNDLALRPAFVPFLEGLLFWLSAPRLESLSLLPGETWTAPVPAPPSGRDPEGGGPRIILPDGTSMEAAGLLEGPAGGSRELRFAGTGRPGIYRLRTGRPEESLGAWAAAGVAIDPAESDAATWPPERILGLFPPERAAAILPDRTIAADTVTGGEGREVWSGIALAVAILLLVETVLSHRFARRTRATDRTDSATRG
jgi:Mg-chelatase subunit ChlD